MNNLPYEINLYIFKFLLPDKDAILNIFLNCRLVNKFFNNLILIIKKFSYLSY